MSVISKLASTSFKHCKHGKHKRVEFNSKEHYTSKSLELLHIELFGLMRTKGLNGEQYFMLMVDDYTRMIVVNFLKKKYVAFEFFKIYKEMIENEIHLKIKCLRSHNGWEFTYDEFQHFCEEQGIDTQLSVARKSQQNGVVERKNRIVEEMARTMLNDSKLSDVYWLQEMETIVHIINRGIFRSNNENIANKLWKGSSSNVKNFRDFRRKCYIWREDKKIEKFNYG